jgi:phage FluMu gp28-like protein
MRRALALLILLALGAIPSAPVAEAVVQLTGYQKRYVEDRARFKIARMARQTGKSFVGMLEPALEMAEHANDPWVVLSAGERQSKKNVDTVATHLRSIQRAAEVIEGEDEFAGTKFKTHEIRLANGAWCIGLPANPDTARGWSANVVLDEFAFHKDSRGIWAALFPTITRGYKLRVLSTPQGKKNKFYELATNPAYSQHVVTIHDAIADGLDLRDEDGQLTTPEALRLALGDAEAWAQEYLVEFLDEATAWLSYELIAAVEDLKLEAEPAWAVELVAAAQAAHRADPTNVQPLTDVALPEFAVPLGLGFDVGRRRDLSVVWLLADEPLARTTAAAIALARQPFGVQERVVWTLLARAPVRRACIDRSGLGMQLAERAVERFGEVRVEGIDFTVDNKAILAGGLKRAFEDGSVAIPVDRTIRESLHSLKRLQTATGNFRFDADRTEATGHADHAWALGLALQALSTGIAAVDVGEPEEAAAPGGGFTRGRVRFWGVRG